MPIFSLTLEQKQKLLKEKGNVQTQLDELKKKKPLDLWRDDIADFLRTLDNFENELSKNEKEADEKVQTKVKKAKGKRSNKTTLPIEPSIDGERVQPVITDKMKKDAAPKVKKEPKRKSIEKRTFLYKIKL